MFKLLESTSGTLTPEIAVRFETMTPSPTERDLSEGRVEYLLERANAGLLVPFNFACAEVGADVFRVNGQHSCAMLKKLGGKFPSDLRVHIDRYRCETMDDLAILFRQLDGRQSSRTSLDVSGAYQGLQPDLKSVPKPIAKLAVEGIVWYKRTVEGIKKLTTSDQAYAMLQDTDLHPFFLWIGNGHILSSKTRECKNIPVVAAMFATFQKDQMNAQDFWKDVCKGGVEIDGDPATTLDEFLVLVLEKKFKTTLPPAQIYQGCIFAWNAFCGNKTIKDVKYGTNKGFLELEEKHA
jgi:hypothetical protein